MHDLPPLPDPAAVERTRRVVVAGHRGDAETVRRHVADPSADVRAAALGALHRCGELDGAVLRDAFRDDASEVRARAAELAPVLGVDPSDLLRDTEPRVVEIAAFACGELDWPEVAPDRFEAPIEVLSQVATTHDDALCRESAAAALGAIGDERGLNAVLVACADRVTVRRRATLALAAFDDPRADAALHDALSDKDWQVRQAAEDLLEVGRSLDGDPDPDAYAQ
ncbi:MAG: hypothetical protein AAF567_12080 [Actinomycetota bacterium]